MNARAVIVSKKNCFDRFICRLAFTNVITDNFPYLNCYNLSETNVTQSIRLVNSFYHARLIRPRPYFVRNLKTVFSLWKRIKCWKSLKSLKSLKNRQSAVMIDLCFRSAQSGKSHVYRAVVLSEKLCFKRLMAKSNCANVFRWYFPINHNCFKLMQLFK